MRISDFPPTIAHVLNDILASGHTLWLIGSRANCRSREDSDWDVLAFGGWDLYKKVSKLQAVPGLDLFVLLDETHFRSPWSESAEGVPKGGSLESWLWKQVSEDRCEYVGQHEHEWDVPQVAIRVVPR
jgi:hypothetical protein